MGAVKELTATKNKKGERAVEKIRNGKWREDIATAEEFESAVNEIKSVVSKYGWGDRLVHPYGYAVKINALIKQWADYEKFSFSSKKIMISEMNGLIDILNKWEEQADEPKVKVIFQNGNVVSVPASYVEDYVACGIAEVVL